MTVCLGSPATAYRDSTLTESNNGGRRADFSAVQVEEPSDRDPLPRVPSIG